MQPLRERASPNSPLEARAIELLRAVERFQPPPGCKSRVRAKLLERKVTRSVRVLSLAPVLALVLLAAGASATLGRDWIAARYRAVAEPAVRMDPSAAPAVRLKTSVPQTRVMTDIGQSARPESESAPVPSVPLRSDTPRASGQRSEQDRLVFDAMRALRREGQPERASMLLDDYLQRHPTGSLAEEALALSIEAASARGDARARELAERYLARYPTGRFRRAAERARARFAP